VFQWENQPHPTTAKNPPVFLVISQAANLPGRGPSSYRGGA
jgi:hypothetical protein